LVKVKASWVIYFQGTQTEDKISIQAINPHSRPVILTSFGLGSKQKNSWTLQTFQPWPVKLPHKLESGESIAELFSYKDVLSGLAEQNKEPSDLGFAWFSTADGKTYRTKLHRNFIKILESRSSS
jgi:hypothetical protein